MTQKHNTSGYPKAATTDNNDVAGAAFINSHETALTRFAGTSDPSSGAPTTWGANEVGYLWLDTTDANTTVLKQWQQLTSGPSTYGWRTLRTPKLILLTTPQDLVAAASTSVDVSYTDQSAASILDSSVQDSGQVLPVVAALLVRVYVKCTGAIPAGDTGYVAVRAKGSTNEIRVHAQVNGKPHYQQVILPLNSSEVAQYAVDTNAGAVTIDYELKIMGAIELT